MPKTQIDTLTIADRLRPVLLRVGRELRREARQVGVSPEQVALLVAIKYSPGIGVRELAARERVSPPALSNRVDRLEEDGLVVRTPSDADRRGRARPPSGPLTPHGLAGHSARPAVRRVARRDRGRGGAAVAAAGRV